MEIESETTKQQFEIEAITIKAKRKNWSWRQLQQTTKEGFDYSSGSYVLVVFGKTMAFEDRTGLPFRNEKLQMSSN